MTVLSVGVKSHYQSIGRYWRICFGNLQPFIQWMLKPIISICMEFFF